MAAFLGALLSAEVIRRPVTMWASSATSEEVVRAVQALEPTREMLFELQADAGIGERGEGGRREKGQREVLE